MNSGLATRQNESEEREKARWRNEKQKKNKNWKNEYKNMINDSLVNDEKDETGEWHIRHICLACDT